MKNKYNLKITSKNKIVLLKNNVFLSEFYNIEDALLYCYKDIDEYTPLSVYFELTNSCNFKCPFCYINFSNKNKKFLKTNDLLKNIDYLYDKGMLYATLSGGECLLHPDFNKIYSYLYDKGILVTILTNGSLINKKIIDLLKEKQPYKVEISIYASNNYLMKKNTKQDIYSLDDLKKNILVLKKNNINIICKMPINKITSSSFFDTYNWCKSNYIQFYYSDELFDKYNEETNDKYILKDKKIQKILEYDKYSLYKQMNFNLVKEKKCFDCIAGKYSMVMSFDDYIYPCFEFRKIKEGIFKINNNIDFAYNNLKKYISYYKNIKLNYCYGCNAYSICQDCVINHINGNINCNLYRKELKKIMKNLEAENKKSLNKYDTKTLYTKRLVLKKGTSKDSIKVYEYDMLKCRGILGEEIIEKVKEPIDFIGEDSKKYYEDIAKEKMFDWYIFLDDKTPIGNITADREIKSLNSIELSFNMHPDYWRKGYMLEAVTKVIEFLFDKGYSNIIIGYDTGNKKSEAFAKKLGFKEYKKISNSYQKNGINIDTYLMILSKNN